MSDRSAPLGGAGIAIGIAIGAAIGVALGNVGMGIGIGIAIGIALGVGMGRQARGGDRPDDDAGAGPQDQPGGEDRR